MAQNKRSDIVLTPSTTGSQLVRHIRSTLKLDDEEARNQILLGAVAQVKTIFGLNDELVQNMEDIQIEDLIALQKGELNGPFIYEIPPDDVEEYDNDPEDVEFLKSEELVKQIANACMTTGSSGKSRVLIKLKELSDELANELEEFVAEHPESSDDMVSTDNQIRELVVKIRGNLEETTTLLYEELTKARQAKTALTTRSSRIKAILDQVENSKDASAYEELLNKKIGMETYLLQDWLTRVFAEFKRQRPELERFFTSYQKEWETYTSNVFDELLKSDSAASYFEVKMNDFLTHKLDNIAFNAILAKEHKHPVLADVVREKAVQFDSGVKLTFSIDKNGFHSIYHLPAKYKSLHFAATIHLTMQLNVKFKDKQVFEIDGSDPKKEKIVVSTKDISNEEEFAEIQNILLASLEKFLKDKGK